MLLSANHDPMGHAIQDYYRTGSPARLRVLSSQFDEDEIPVKTLFRTFEDMPYLEQRALQLANGKILDVGAGAGCHSLVLQSRGKDVKAIDISTLAVETMKQRGVREAQAADIFTDDFGREFNTILLMMNGLGIAGKLKKLPSLLARCHNLLAPGGCILTDSTDLRYLFEDEITGYFYYDGPYEYYGETDYQMAYRDIKSTPFNWLYIDAERLKEVANTLGFDTEVVKKGDYYNFLAKLTKR